MVVQDDAIDGQPVHAFSLCDLIDPGRNGTALVPVQVFGLARFAYVVDDVVVLLVHRRRCFVDDVAGDELADVAAHCDFSLHY